jgi:uncharacterized integral membrane protein
MRNRQQQIRRVLCRAESDTQSPQEEVYQGQFGEWSIDSADRQEVALYRGGLTVAAVALFLATVIGLLLPINQGLTGRVEDVLALGGAAGLGVSLWFIHIYVAPLKKFIQGLWAVGLGSALILAAKQDTPLVQQVVSNPVTVWGVGPFFAAVTGVAFKEGMCYGKPEAGALFFVTPLLLLGHLTGWIPPNGQRALLVTFMALFSVFAARKYTQPVKDDLGDKSVFEFLKLPEAEQQRRLAELRTYQGD